MCKNLIAIALLICASQTCMAQSEPVAPLSSGKGVCLFTGEPPPEYTYVVAKKLKYGKSSYGSVNDLLPKVVGDANAVGADAIIHYNGAQRFGFWPWKFVRPVITGTAVKWSPAREVDCAGAGGYFTNGTLNEAPPPPAR